MIELIHPAFVIVALGFFAWRLPRRLSYVVGLAGLTGVFLYIAVVPSGMYELVSFVGFELVVEINDVTRLMGVTFAGFGVAAVGYAMSTDVGRTHLLVALCYVSGSLFTVLSGDWVSLAIGWEMMAIASTVLIWLSKGDAVRSGFRYAVVHAVGGSLLLIGLAAHGATVGITPETFHFTGDGITEGFATILVAVGILINAAIIGFHIWLPDAYSRPHVATSVFLSAYTTKAAVYATYRAFPDGNVLIAYIGGIMAVFGATYAVTQKDMRRLLAYHIQAQIGYMLAGVGIGTSLGIAGGFAHLLNNVLFKGLLFMVAGAIVLQTGKEKLDKFGALGAQSIILLATFVIAALSITAVPGFNGYVSKKLVLDAASSADLTGVWLLLTIGAVGTFLSFIKFGYYAFLSGEPQQTESIPSIRSSVMIVIAGICVLFGIWYELLFSILPHAESIDVAIYTFDGIAETAILAGVGLFLFVAGKSIIQNFSGGIDINRVRDPATFYGMQWITGTVKTAFQNIDATVSELSWRCVLLVRNPTQTIERALPEPLATKYHSRKYEVPGTTGLRIGLGMSIAVVLAVLITGLVFGILIT